MYEYLETSECCFTLDTRLGILVTRQKREGEGQCNQYLLLKCRKRLVLHSETILSP